MVAAEGGETEDARMVERKKVDADVHGIPNPEGVAAGTGVVKPPVCKGSPLIDCWPGSAVSLGWSPGAPVPVGPSPPGAPVSRVLGSSVVEVTGASPTVDVSLARSEVAESKEPSDVADGKGMLSPGIMVINGPIISGSKVGIRLPRVVVGVSSPGSDV